MKISGFKWLLIGVFLCELSSILSLSFKYYMYIRLLGIAISVVAFFRFNKSRLFNQDFLFVFLFIQTVFIIIRGSLMGNHFVYYENNEKVVGLYKVVRHFLVYPHSGLAFLVPFVFLIKVNLKELVSIRAMSLICVFVSAFSIFLFFDIITNVGDYGAIEINIGEEQVGISYLMSNLCIGFGAILLMSLCFRYLKGAVYWLLPVSVFSYFIINLIAASRGGVVSSVLYILIFMFFYFKYARKQHQMSRVISLLFWVVVIILFVRLVIYMSTNSWFDYFIFRIEKGETLDNNNRTLFTNALIKDFNSDPMSWVWGRGINGSYSVMGSQRVSMEWGWLWYILKGGILYLATYVFILLRTFYRGCFKSENVLCKAFGMLALIQVYSLLPFGLPQVNLWCLLIWIGVGFINRPNILMMSDSEIQQYFESYR